MKNRIRNEKQHLYHLGNQSHPLIGSLNSTSNKPAYKSLSAAIGGLHSISVDDAFSNRIMSFVDFASCIYILLDLYSYGKPACVVDIYQCDGGEKSATKSVSFEIIYGKDETKISDVIAHIRSELLSDDEILSTNERIDLHRPPLLLTNANYEENESNAFVLPYDLVFSFQGADAENEPILKIVYNSNHYEYGYIQQLKNHFLEIWLYFSADENLVSAIRPTLPHSTAINDFNAPHGFGHRTIVDSFDKQVYLNANKLAVISNSTTLTYQDLSREVDKLAGYILDEFGSEIRDNNFIGVYLDKSHVSIICFLAVLKAGCVYVPIDPNLPKGRVLHYINDTALKVVLTTTKYFYQQKWPGVKCIPVDIIPDASSDRELSFPEVHPNAAAYVIYTSGSTGKPKGVLINHRSISNLAEDHILKLQITREDNILQMHSHAFDASILDFVMTLCAGATLVMPNEDVVQDSNLFLKFVESNNVSIITVSPSYLNNLGHWKLGSVRTVITGGERAIRKDVIFYAQQHENFYNAYGPSEATVNTSLYRASSDLKYSSVPIGCPGLNKKLYIVDARIQALPQGAIGEICIAGEGIALGYLNLPELTHERFIANPFVQDEILYRTGDLGRLLTDGNYEFIGRLDDQVKIHGFRIELGEIISCLNNHEDIDDSFVFLDNEQRLMAFIKMRKDAAMEESGLRSYLANFLPHYMIPAEILMIEEIPLTVEGKVDKDQLMQIVAATEAEAPLGEVLNETQSTIADIWSLILNKTVNLDSDFFKLGGDSLKAIQFVSKMRTKGYKVEVQDIFDFPVVSDLADAIKRLEEPLAADELVIGEHPATPIQLEISRHGDMRQLSRYSQTLSLDLVNQMTRTDLALVLNKLLSQYPVFRTKFSIRSNQLRPFYSGVFDEINLKEVDLRKAIDASKQMDVEIAKLNEELDLEKGRLVAGIISHLPNQTVLSLVINHFIVDTVSWTIIVDDFDDLLDKFLNKKELRIATTSTSFLKWSKKLYEHANSADIHLQRANWSLTLASGMSAIPRDHAFVSNKFEDQAVLISKISEKTTGEMLAFRGVFDTLDMQQLLLISLVLTIHKTCNADSIGILVERHGRENIFEGIDISRTVGWFTSFFPLLIDCAGCKSPSDVVRTVNTTYNALTDNGLSFGQLNYLNQNSAGFYEQLPQISFNYFGEINSELTHRNFNILEDFSKPQVDGEMTRVCEVDFSFIIRDNRLIMQIAYNKHMFQLEKIEFIANGFEASIAETLRFFSNLENSFPIHTNFTVKDIALDDLNNLFD